MHIAAREKIVLLGFLSHYPVAGVAWQTIHYLEGLRRLGYEVYYVEAHGCTPSKLMRSESDDGVVRAAEYISRILGKFNFEGRWAYHAIYDDRYFGLSELQLKELFRSASLIINLHGSHIPNPELTATNRLVFLETDPVDVQMELSQGKQSTIDYLSPHCAFFSYGENLGNPDCLVPLSDKFRFRPTRQPVVLDFWIESGVGSAGMFTTIGNWRQPWRKVTYQGQVYTWSKHFEFLKFIDLPGRVKQPFELALSSYDASDQQMLEAKGWRVRPALDFSQDLDAYRGYIGESRGEFTVAKDQNIRLRSGWFSDRAATYLAAGRPVITQETAFSNIFPTSEGLFAFSTMEEIVAAVETINSDYEHHRSTARTIACEYFSHEVVLGKLLADLGMSRPRRPLEAEHSRVPSGYPPLGAEPSEEHVVSDTRRVRTTGSSVDLRDETDPQTARPDATLGALPSTLMLTPTGRWPTRLPEETVRTALALPAPRAGCRKLGSKHRASIVVITHNGLPYTKMCLTCLLGDDWHSNDELIVVDNASTDGTVDYLRDTMRNNPGVRLILNEQNRGFAAANNQALAAATRETLILLNNDTLTPSGWREGLTRWLDDPKVGLVGPVTNRTCNEAQIDSPYRTFSELQKFADDHTRSHRGESFGIRMLAMFCVAMRRDVFQRIGPLDEQFEVGMFEDDDYACRVRAAGLRVLCAEDVFVHHFGQASFGELCVNGEYDRVQTDNRRRFEKKWGVVWEPHARRITPEYNQLRERIQETVSSHLPAGTLVAVVSKGDDQLVRFNGRNGWHFPLLEDGSYANQYPAHSDEAIQQLEAVRARGARYFLLPRPAFWWLEHYNDFRIHLESRYTLTFGDQATCLIFDLGKHYA